MRCLHCGSEFERNHYRQKFCSKVCKDEFHKLRYVSSDTTEYGKSRCPSCKKTFIKDHPKRKFCSDRCAKRSIEESYTKKPNWGSDVCLSCNKIFVKNTYHQKYCSAECRKVNKDNSKTKASKNCNVCQKEFRGGANRKYCSKDCSDKSKIKINKFSINKRDSFSCLLCGASPLTNPSCLLEVASIVKPISSADLKAFSLFTICDECNQNYNYDLETSTVEELYLALKERNKKSGIYEYATYKTTYKHNIVK